MKNDFSVCEVRYYFFWMLDMSGGCKVILLEKFVKVFVRSELVGGRVLSFVDVEVNSWGD